jgi:hypothetical protein
MKAAESGQLGALQFLLESGARRDATDDNVSLALTFPENLQEIRFCLIPLAALAHHICFLDYVPSFLSLPA